MDVMIPLSALLLIILLFPFISFLWKRVFLWMKWKVVCKRNGLQWFPTHFFWFLGNFKGGKCDFYVQTPERVYSVKLCGASSKTFIDFGDDTHYSRRSIRFHISSVLPVPRVKRKKEFDFRYHCPENLRTAQIKPIVLMDPMPLKVTYANKEIGNGDFTGEGYFYDRAGFLRLLSDETAGCTEKTDRANCI